MYNYNNYNSFGNHRGNRFIGGGFVGPFILGGIAGGLIANNRPNNFSYPVFVPFYPPYPPSQFNQFYY